MPRSFNSLGLNFFEATFLTEGATRSEYRPHKLLSEYGFHFSVSSPHVCTRVEVKHATV